MSFRLPSPVARSRIALVGTLLILILFLIWTSWSALFPFILGALFAYFLLPSVDFLDQHAPRFLRRTGWSRPLAIIVMYIVVLGLIAGILSYFVPVVIGQAKVFGHAVPAYFESTRGEVQRYVTLLFENIPPEIQTTVNDSLTKATGTIMSGIQKGLELTFVTVTQTIGFIVGLIIVPVWLFYVLKDEAKERDAFYRLIPAKSREDVRCILRIIDELFGAYIRGQLLLCLTLGIMATIALLILRVDLALLLGTLVGIFEIVPVVGPYLGAAPAVLVALTKSPVLALWVLLSFVIIQQIEHIFLVPRISGRAVRFPPAAVMIIVVVGSQVGGILGILVAVPAAAMIRDVFQYLYLRTAEPPKTPDDALAAVLVSKQS
jgi:predicted PurR-regulated permease PerM